jgi:hypothetical protein
MNNSKTITMKKSNRELITTNQADIICDALANGKTLTEILEDQKTYPFSLMKFYAYLKKNPELEIKITEARKYGVQTLIDKLLQVFKYQEIEDPNAILWIREKTKFITFLANKLTDLYSDNKPIKQNIDQKMTISWEDTEDDLIDVSGDITDIPPDNKD